MLAIIFVRSCCSLSWRSSAAGPPDASMRAACYRYAFGVPAQPKGRSACFPMQCQAHGRRKPASAMPVSDMRFRKWDKRYSRLLMSVADSGGRLRIDGSGTAVRRSCARHWQSGSGDRPAHQDASVVGCACGGRFEGAGSDCGSGRVVWSTVGEGELVLGVCVVSGGVRARLRLQLRESDISK